MMTRMLMPCACAAFLAAASTTTQAQTNFGFDLHDSDQPFEPGHSCAELGYLSDAELKEAVSPAFQSDFQAFCHPEEPQACSDYTPELKGLGHLAPGDDGYHCRFIPAAK